MKKKFVPEKDITAYELAVIVARTTTMGTEELEITPAQWADELIPDGLDRHFKEKK